MAPIAYAVLGVTETWRNRLILAAPLVGILILALARPSDDGPTVCAFALCTGTACPGCGMTRAASYLIRGDFGTAITYHPLIPLIGAQLLAGWAWFVMRRAGWVGPMSRRTVNITLLGTALALALVWGLRLATGTLPPV